MKLKRSTYHDDGSVSVGPKVTSLEDVTEVGGARGQDEAVCGHVTATGGGQEYVGERFRVQERRHGAVQVSPVAVPFQLEVLRRR